MNKLKIQLFFISIAILSILVLPNQINAWPSSDQGGLYWVNEVTTAPVIDGVLEDSEWSSGEETFRETFSQALVYGDTQFYNGQNVNGMTLVVTMLIDDQNLYVKVVWETNVLDGNTHNSIGLAFAAEDPAAMRQTMDRKVAFFNATTSQTTTYDLWNCESVDEETIAFYGENVNDTVTDVPSFCGLEGHYQPGVMDSEVEFSSAFGFDEETSQAFYEFQIPRDTGNSMEDWLIEEGTVIEIVGNPFGNMAELGVGHGAVGTNPLVISFEERCFFCQPGEGMNGNAIAFNAFFALMISAIFATFIISGQNKEFAKKMWKVKVTEDMAAESVIMEMAYYNSSFLSLLVVGFFMMYSGIGLLYGLWAQWGFIGLLINGIPLALGAVAGVDLLMRNHNPQTETSEALGTDVHDSGKFWLVPTLFLAVTLLMLVFIGIDVIA